MNVKQKVIAVAVAAVVAIVAIVSTGGWIHSAIVTHRVTTELEQCRGELGQLRAELTKADDRQRVITKGLDDLEDRLRDSEAVLSISVTTVSGLKEQIRILRKSYEDMEDIINSLNSNNTANNNTANSE